MADAVVQANGRDVARLLLFVPNEGVWFADLNFASAEPLTGAVTITLGASTLKGTVDDTASGVFGLQRKVRVIGGAGGWRKELAPMGYRNDAGVKASQVAADAAREVGETLGTFAGGVERLGAHYLSDAGPASHTIEDVARGVPWWVDYAGVTQVSVRTTSTPPEDSYTVVTCDPRSRNVELSVPDLEAVRVGSILTAGLEEPLTVNAFELEVTPERIRMHAWCGTGRGSSLANSLRTIVERVTDKRITWPVRYRVANLAGDRVDLQVVKKAVGIPDALSVPLWPGIAGAHIVSTLGAEVIVQFVDGDRSDPIVTSFAGRAGSMPQRVVFGSKTGEGADAARSGDVVKLALPPFQFSGTIGGSPATGLLTAVLPVAYGLIITGSPAVGIGNDH
jgi:hypothetical protein